LCGSLALAAVACVLFPFVINVYMLAAISFVLGIGLGCCGPLSMVITYNRAPEGRSGEAMGLRQSFNKFTEVLVPLIFGTLGSAFGIGPAFWMDALLLGGGALGNIRLLSPKTVELMTSNHTSDIPPGNLVGPGAAFGLGFRIVLDPAATQTSGSAGMYGWTGIYGTVFWVDPKEQLVAIMMVQRYPGPTEGAAFQPLVYQAITKSLEGK